MKISLHPWFDINRHFSIHIALPIIILFEGFASIAIEILTIRQLLPVAGGSVIVTSIVIGMFLLFLALGYRKGGRIKQNLHRKLRINFLIAACWTGIGLSYLFVQTFFYSTELILGNHIIYPLLAYLFFVISPLIYILGQTVPITMNLVKDDQSPGLIGGDTLGLSTLGSFLGATATTLILMQYLGVGWTVVMITVLLLFMNLLLAETNLIFSQQLFFNIITILVIYIININVEHNVFVATNNYSNYQIVNLANMKNEKILFINNSPSSHIDNNKTGFKYIEMIKQILFNDLKLRNANILVLGAGGFTLSAQNTYHNQFTYIDIDRKIKQVVFSRFLKNINGKLIADDARHFIHSTAKQFQAIVVDTYSNMRSIPAHLLTYEYMSELKRALLPNGTIIFNVIAKPFLADLYSKRVDNTIRLVFKNCMVIPEIYSKDVTNVLYVCQKTNIKDDKIYSDNLNTSTTDSFEW